MFTSEDIRQITFEKGMRGYKPEDVESFIEKIADEFEALENEKKDLEEKLYVLAEKIEQYKAEEESIKVTLIQSQRLGESIIADAKEKAANIERDATIKKNNIISSAYAEIEGSEETVKRLQKEASDFKRMILGLYKEHIETLSKIPDAKAETAVEEPAPVEEEPVEETVEEATTLEFEIIPEETAVEEETVAEEVAEEVPSEDKFKNISSLFEE